MALAEFQSVSQKEAGADLPSANTLNSILHFTSVGLALVFILSLLILIASGVHFVSAGGDENVLDTAHSLWRLATLGLVLALIGYIIVNLIKFFI